MSLPVAGEPAGEPVSITNMEFQPCHQLELELQLIDPLLPSDNCGCDIYLLATNVLIRSLMNSLVGPPSSMAGSPINVYLRKGAKIKNGVIGIILKLLNWRFTWFLNLINIPLCS